MDEPPLYFSVNPFGILRVVFDPDFNARVLLNDATRHGMQSVDPARSHEPLAYFHREGPLGDVFAAWHAPASGARVGLIGLGAGCIAAYAKPGEHFTFFEINPAVANVATDPQLFTYLSECRGTYNIVLGDGLESISASTDATFDLLVLDAFVDDVPPPHLVSAAALDTYLRKLTPAGWLVIHSSPHAPLPDDIQALITSGKAAALMRADRDVSDAERAAGRLPCAYLVLSRAEESLTDLAAHPNWARLPALPRPPQAK
jgi:hypothetical protein